MTKPKIYTVAHPEDLSPPLKNQGFCVDVVLASDYAELEHELTSARRKIEVLMAENAALKKFISQSCYSYDGDGRDVCDSYICATESPLLPETPATEAAIAEIRNEIASPLVNALTTIANSEQINSDSFVCDFATLVSVAAGALRNHYAQQLRAEASKKLSALRATTKPNFAGRQYDN
ncbi:TPA: hypothetical protein ACXE8V_001092 [Pluralibacter gergoviae]